MFKTFDVSDKLPQIKFQMKSIDHNLTDMFQRAPGTFQTFVTPHKREILS